MLRFDEAPELEAGGGGVIGWLMRGGSSYLGLLKTNSVEPGARWL